MSLMRVNGAVFTSGAATMLRLGQLTSRQGEVAAGSLLSLVKGEDDWQTAIDRALESHLDFVRSLTSLYGLSAVTFLAELDELRSRAQRCRASLDVELPQHNR
jgi:hypothetical protein